MNIQIKTSSGINLVPIDTNLLSSRNIFLNTEITSETAIDVIKKIMFLSLQDKHKPINIFVTSGGGEINAGMMIYDIIQSIDTPIKMYCLGRAYSMAAVLFASGNHGRYMLPNSELMLHEPLLGNKIGGNSSSIKSISDTLIKTRDKMNKILSIHTGKSIEEVEEATNYDHYYTPQESIDFGLCDKIIGFDEIMEELYE